jgi:hypothetical protein
MTNLQKLQILAYVPRHERRVLFERRNKVDEELPVLQAQFLETRL